MQNLKTLIESFQFNEPISLGKKFTIIPVKSSFEPVLNYISLEEALSTQKLILTEVDEQGSVNSIIATNLSNDYILLVEGDVLVGSKQNRTLNTTILLEPNCNSKIPVSCIESGRWRFSSRHFSPGFSTIPYHLREMMHKDVKESLRQRRKYDADQSKVWSSIDKEYDKMNLSSETSDLDFLMKEKIRRQKIPSLEINLDKSIQGIILFVNNSLNYVEYFSKSEFFQEFYTKLLRGLILDYDYYDESRIKEEIDYIFFVKNFFRDLLKPEGESIETDSVSAGKVLDFTYSNLRTDLRFLEFNNEIIHLIVFKN